MTSWCSSVKPFRRHVRLRRRFSVPRSPISRADPETHEQITSRFARWDDMRIHVGGEVLKLEGFTAYAGSSAVAVTDLQRARRSSACGYETRRGEVARRGQDEGKPDVCVACDGVSKRGARCDSSELRPHAMCADTSSCGSADTVPYQAFNVPVQGDALLPPFPSLPFFFFFSPFFPFPLSLCVYGFYRGHATLCYTCCVIAIVHRLTTLCPNPPVSTPLAHRRVSRRDMAKKRLATPTKIARWRSSRDLRRRRSRQSAGQESLVWRKFTPSGAASGPTGNVVPGR